jgi:hypothetical protein
MSVLAPAKPDISERVEPRRRISWLRLLWVAPLTLVAAVLVCLGLRSVFQALDPNLQRMGQLGPPMLTLAVEGALAAIVVFVLFALFVPRAIFWYRILGVVALVLSWLPDIGLGLGGTPMRLAMRYVAPLTTVGIGQTGGPPPGGPPPGAQTGGPPPGFNPTSGMPVEQVLVLMALHAAVAIVCIGLLTTLTQRRVSRPVPSE